LGSYASQASDPRVPGSRPGDAILFCHPFALLFLSILIYPPPESLFLSVATAEAAFSMPPRQYMEERGEKGTGSTKKNGFSSSAAPAKAIDVCEIRTHALSD
jgi:hypothetical protein